MTSGVYDRSAFAAEMSVSRETLERLDRFAGLLADWQTRMNLVGPATLPDIWRRHFLDSAQIARLVPDFSGHNWVDIGAGAGFPGLVLAIMGAGHVHLVDSIAKKVRFLEAVRADLGLEASVTVHCGRIETLPLLPASRLTARAVAPLERLLDWTAPYWRAGVAAYFLKGESASEELTQARKFWTLDCTSHVSLSDARGRIVEIRAARRRPSHR